jgi:hypothetical protein
LPEHRGRPRGHCTICQHVERTRAELLLAGAASFASVARKFTMSPDALTRHWRNHVSAERRAALIMGPVQRTALAARVAEESESVLDHHRVVRAGLYQRYGAALDAGDNMAVGLLAGRLTEINNAISRLTGELANSPLIQNNTVNFFMSPEFATFQADLIRVLSRFPDAYEAVLAEFDRLEAAPSQLPALEHISGAEEAA